MNLTEIMLFDTSKVARMLSVNAKTVRRWVGEGRIGYVRAGNKILFSPDQVSEFIRNHRVKSNNEIRTSIY